MRKRRLATVRPVRDEMSKHNRLTRSRFTACGLFVLVVCSVMTLTRTAETETGKRPTSQPEIPDLRRSRLNGWMAIGPEHPESQLPWSLHDSEPKQSNQPRVSLPNFDVRLDKNSSSSDYIEKSRSAASSAGADRASKQAIGLVRMQTNLKGSEVIESTELGTPEVVSATPGSGFLSGPTKNRPEMLRSFLSNYADAYGISAQQVESLELVADYVNPAGNMAWVEFEQRLNGLPVFQGLIRGGFTAKGEMAGITGLIAPILGNPSLESSPHLGAAEAVSIAAANVGWNVDAGTLIPKSAGEKQVTFARGTMSDDAKAWLVYFPLSGGFVRLAWATEIWGDPDAFLILLDAQDGTILFRKNLTSYQTQAASYNIFTGDSPAPMSPSTVLPGPGTQAPYVARTLLTLTGSESPNTFNNLGWITDGANSGNGWTDGNNVQAGIDRDGINGVDAPVSGVNRVFNFACSPETDDPLTPSCQNAEVTDVFYWANLYHDRLYLLGFTEPAGNYQNDNFGRGGFAADRISAEVQDSSGTNNANFTAPPDGSRGRLQLFIFNGPTPNRSPGLDHDVVLHELTHGTSSRLHNNSTGLTSVLAGGMGEGWSDFFARALLSTPDEDPNGIYTTGGWVTYELAPGFHDNYYYGIRRFPYAVKSTVGPNGRPYNPLTLADIDSAQINIRDGAFAPNPLLANSFAFEVHNIGEVWCMALLEVRARFINRLGFATGNQRILQFVTDAMKLDPINPTLLQGRDSIIAAANAGGGTADDIADIRAGFAARGMGVTAQIVNPFVGTVVESFDTTVPANTGHLIGHVRHSENNAPFLLATITANPGGRFAATNADGSYELYLPVGIYTITATAGDYIDASTSGVSIADHADTTQDFSLQRSPHLIAQLGEPSGANVKLADLDGDGKNEVIVTSFQSIFGTGHVHVLSPTGNELAGWPVTLDGRPVNNTPAVGDIDGDGQPDIVVQTFGNALAPDGTDTRKVWAFTTRGIIKPGFPVVVSATPTQEGWGGGGLFSNAELPSPALADLNGDGIPEIVVIAPGSAFGTDAGIVMAWTGDGTLLFKTALPRSATTGTLATQLPLFAVPMVGNLVGDSAPEIVVGVQALTPQQHTDFFALTAAGALLPGWPVHLGPTAGPRIEFGALGDLFRDGHDELVVTYSPRGSLAPGAPEAPAQLYVFDGSGNVVSGFPKDLPGSGPVDKSPGRPALADVDHDGFLDIVTVVSDQLHTYLVAYDRFGHQLAQIEVPGLPSPLPDLESVALAEDANGQVCAVFPTLTKQVISQLIINAMGLNGQAVPGFPVTLPILCYSSSCHAATSIALGQDKGSNQVYSVLVDRSGNVRRWDIFNSTGRILWSQYQQNAANNGRVQNQQTLTITKAGTGTGSVTSSPSAISCGASCSAAFNTGALVTLTAAADTGSIFSGWSGDCSGWGTCQVTMPQLQAGKVTATFATIPVTLQFNAAGYSVNEADGSVNITVTRSGDVSGAARIGYATSNATAKEGKDYVASQGFVDFGAGETSKSFPVLIIDNAFVDGARTVNLTLDNPSGATLGAQNSAALTINDNDVIVGVNPLDQPRTFVQSNYYDFLGRYPDASGWDFWSGQITACGTNVSCTEVARINTSGAFFLAIEFQETGYLVERMYKAAYGSATGNSTLAGGRQLSVPIVRFDEFLRGTQRIGKGVVVLTPGWEQLLESNKVTYANEFVQTSRFMGAFPTTMTPAAFVDKLNQNGGSVLSSTERTATINLFAGASDSRNLTARAQAVRQVAENANLAAAERNRAFVLAQYFGYLRRDPNSAPDGDYTGYDFWLTKLNQFNGDYIAAEMVKAFISSQEYRQRFGP
jgi:hypothetical protein